jgi:Icc-related predicted phosphoesterase
MIIECVSDLHGYCPKLEGGDLLVVAGDLTARDDPKEHFAMWNWLSCQKYKKVIISAGNHDNFLQSKEGNHIIGNWNPAVSYLCDSGTEFEYYNPRFPEEDTGFLASGKRTFKIWGSPWTLRFKGMNPHCMAFTCETEEELAEKWALIPDDVDILVTHSPPHGCYLDQNRKGNMLGSISLRDRIWKLNLKLHIFGHIHEGYGVRPLIGPPNCVNASHVNERYEPVNKPIRIEL